MKQTGTAVSLTGVGTALGIIAVWALDTFALAEPMPSEVAIAVGTVITGGLFFIRQTLDRRNEHAHDRDLKPGGTD